MPTLSVVPCRSRRGRKLHDLKPGELLTAVLFALDCLDQLLKGWLQVGPVMHEQGVLSEEPGVQRPALKRR
jgi:hypothetical protein